MLNEAIINPKSIVVVGGSNNLSKPGGKIVANLKKGSFRGELSVVNPREKEVQSYPSFPSVNELGEVDLAILSIPARFCPETVEELAAKHSTKGFIVISAGFGETDDTGAKLEEILREIVDHHGATLIGPNCIGVITQHYQGVFTLPVPPLDPKGVDLISGSGATAVFIMESGMQHGLRFNQVFSVGNSTQTGVEDVLQHMDETFDPDQSSKIKLLYIEKLTDPRRFLEHSSSLIRKGARIAAIKPGFSKAGSRAASSHTGAVATPDVFVRALFRKAGIVYCSSRTELISVASLFTYKPITGKNIAVITHAGGSAVMLTDSLEKSGLEVPPIAGKEANQLLSHLYPGSSVSNPIDFLATGTADQLGIIIDYVEHKFDHIDAMVVVFGSAGLFDVENVYRVLHVKMDVCDKPIYPVLPSVVNAHKEIEYFLAQGRVNFPDEVELGVALGEVMHTPQPSMLDCKMPPVDTAAIQNTLKAKQNEMLSPKEIEHLLEAAGINMVREFEVQTLKQALEAFEKIGSKVAMKVIGPVHKTDIGGVSLNIASTKAVEREFNRLFKLPGATGVLIQPMLKGRELYAGAIKEGAFGHLVMCGLGGINIEVFKDIKAGLSPVSEKEALTMIKRLKSYKILKGYRNQQGIDIQEFAKIISRLSALLEVSPQIVELDLNPIIATENDFWVVDARVRVE
ncbi:MAG TPA: CoA ligase [Flavobacteriales bacterium]|jgi:acyl-CoA synthetase (NDP forming)|nr:CoA ligase [Flavobacteriales bacterium]